MVSQHMEARKLLQVWTDGACVPNPGVGGWGYTLKAADGSQRGEAFGGERHTTNNRMEMQAILMALRALPDGAAAVVYSDSQYCINGLTIWRKGWKRRDWRKKGGAPLLNRDLWLELEAETARVKATFLWVRGHNGDPGNERADALAERGRQEAKR